ncbi:MAG: hypothetical protein A2782_02665 [Candidatus Blackburnbacteria bacterium RIFCSPHIGHO2_01_FULL_43_15b]|uniref:ATP synthase F1 complex delta/epsilon subunit N-terminal domain-containing protein n=1 Tax=Candidatus Blackburnbacteria bacterium RIFCSPHIGHO2_01_FULL_43_15b TaxID=1797513 RepID=A0A1G1V1Y7_9BACT|nr:MAG: hypothetical protein A2782_02665 [Candidatus Blackburnbacteria bacterium RIFCSPHIGHO2_01_FULL_43_15b]
MVFHLFISSPFQKLYEGDVEYVSSENSSGKFDILPHHANFISIIEDKEIIAKTANGKVETFKFLKAIMLFQDNSLKIYTDLSPSYSESIL